MAKIIAVVAGIVSAALAFVLGRRSKDNGRQRDIRGAFDDINETAGEVGDAGDGASTASAEVGGIAEGIGNALSIAEDGRDDAQRADELIAELRRRAGEGSKDG